MAERFIIDVSEHNTVTDWRAVKADGIEGVIIRAGYGRGNVDKKFREHITGALAAGLHVGIYWFSYAYSADMAEAEAYYCMNTVSDVVSWEDITLPIYWDFEGDSMKFANKCGVDVSRETLVDMAEAFCDALESEGHMPGIYSNLDYEKRYGLLTTAEQNGWSVWYAQYNYNMDSSVPEPDMWQYTSGGQVNGIAGNVDMNKLLNPDIINVLVTRGPEGSTLECGKGVLTVWCFYRVDGGDDVFWFNGDTVRLLTNRDQKTILEKIYKEATGRDIITYDFKSASPWHKRLIQACTLPVLTAEDGVIGK